MNMWLYTLLVLREVKKRGVRNLSFSDLRRIMERIYRRGYALIDGVKDLILDLQYLRDLGLISFAHKNVTNLDAIEIIIKEVDAIPSPDFVENVKEAVAKSVEEVLSRKIPRSSEERKEG